MLSELKKAAINYRIVAAIDDRDMNLRASDTVDPAYFERSDWRPGRIGNGLSHLRAYEEILADDVDHALVLEDDVILAPQLTSLLNVLEKHLVGAEIALLHFENYDTCELSSEGATALPGSRLLALPIDICVPVGAAAYVITREACERMSKRILPIRAHSDDWNYWYSQGALDRVRCVFPRAVTKDARFESTIDYSSPTGLKARVLRVSKRHRLRPVMKLISYRRKAIWRNWTRAEIVDKPFVNKPSRL
jgi:GR25 family glycosyltransferase involved in LPS biosynthesis